MDVLEAQQQSLEQQLEARAMRGDQGAAEVLKKLREGGRPLPQEEVTLPSAPTRREELQEEFDSIAQAARDGDAEAITRVATIHEELNALEVADQLEAAAARQREREAAREKREREAQALRDADAEYESVSAERKRLRAEGQKHIDSLLVVMRRLQNAYVSQHSSGARADRLDGATRYVPPVGAEERSLVLQLKSISQSLSMAIGPVQGTVSRLDELP